MAYNFVRASDIKNKTVLFRVDMNEEIDDHGRIADDFRIQAILPTIEFLREHNAKIVIISHAGRPEGKRDEKFTLKPMAERLADLLNYKFVVAEKSAPEYPVPHVVFVTEDLTEKSTLALVEKIADKDIVVLENLRYYEGEEDNDEKFAKHLAAYGEVYINDAFAVCHRKAASIVAITKLLPSFVGPLIEKEIKNLDYVLTKAKHPFVVMMGGIKITDKAKTLENLGRKADKLLLGGGIANLLFQAKGLEIGNSAVELEGKDIGWRIAKNLKAKIVLPKDVVVGNKAADRSSAKTKSAHDIKPNDFIYDMGPKTILEFAEILKSAETICWNGPMGRFEQKPFHNGTLALARLIGSLGKRKAFVIAGGGETVAAIRQAHQEDNIDHLSTGGGAMLEYLAGNELPGLKALQK